MSKKNTVLHEEQQAKIIELLNRRLADTIDLHRRAVFTRQVLAFDCRGERPHRCAFDDAHRLRQTCSLRQRAGERTEGRRYRRYLHRNRPRHRQVALVRRDEPAIRQLNSEVHLTLFITLCRYT